MNKTHFGWLLVLAASLSLTAGCSKKPPPLPPGTGSIMTPKEKDKATEMYTDYMTKMSPSAKGAAENLSKFKDGVKPKTGD